AIPEGGAAPVGAAYTRRRQPCPQVTAHAGSSHGRGWLCLLAVAPCGRPPLQAALATVSRPYRGHGHGWLPLQVT
ncbi:hypothetical protein BHE74_00027362, partial [Ensete ventricosum]